MAPGPTGLAHPEEGRTSHPIAGMLDHWTKATHLKRNRIARDHHNLRTACQQNNRLDSRGSWRERDGTWIPDMVLIQAMAPSTVYLAQSKEGDNMRTQPYTASGEATTIGGECRRCHLRLWFVHNTAVPGPIMLPDRLLQGTATQDGISPEPRPSETREEMYLHCQTNCADHPHEHITMAGLRIDQRIQ